MSLTVVISIRVSSVQIFVGNLNGERRRATARKAQKNDQPIKYQLGAIGCILLNYDTV